jgi:hypothetical protein
MQIDKCDRDEYSTNESIIYSMQDWLTAWEINVTYFSMIHET